MATSQFQSFGIGGGAFVLSPAAWAAASVRSQGFPSGILPKENLNTALRQATSVSAMIAAFTAAHQAANVLDDGDLTTLQNQFKAALDSLYSGIAPGRIVSGQVQSTAFPGTTSFNLSLSQGTWLVDASAGIFESAFYANTLSIDGVSALARGNFGDQAGVNVSPLGAFASVVVAGPANRNVAISWAQESGGTSWPVYLRAIAFKTA